MTLALIATVPACNSIEPADASACATVSDSTLPDFPIRIEPEFEEKAKLVVEIAEPKEVCEPVGSTILFPVPFRLSPLNVGLNTSSVTELFELITVPDE